MRMGDNHKILLDIAGWLAAVLLLAAYWLISNKRVAGDSVGYQSLNIVGSILLMANTAYYGAYPSAFVNLVWLGIAVYALRGRLAGFLSSGRAGASLD
jgi:hypothetical protein